MGSSEPTPPAGDRAAGASALRISDAERNAAVEALGEHMANGRIDLDEYGTRSASASTARTVGDLQALFADLPAPHPLLPGVGSAQVQHFARPATAVATAGGLSPAVTDDRSRAQKFVAAAAGASTIIALILFFATSQWWWFLLIPLISSVAGGVWGDGWRRPDRRRR